MNRFFWYCAGVHIPTIEQMPYEKSKYVGIGSAVFFTGLFAAMAGSYALHFVFDSLLLAIAIGMVWGLFIFSLDRFIVSSMRKTGSVSKEVLLALPRIVLAIFISMVIATPLELKIFEKEITSELLLMENGKLAELENERRARYLPTIDQLRSEMESLTATLAQKAQHRDQLREIARQEADGTGGSMVRNAGPIYQLKKRDADKAEEELAEYSLTANQQLDDLRTKLNDTENQMAVDLSTLSAQSVASGLAGRIDALANITSKSNAIWMAHLFIVILFIIIETAPVVVKLMSSSGPYDYAVGEADYEKRSAYFMRLTELRGISYTAANTLQEPESIYVNRRLSLEEQ